MRLYPSASRQCIFAGKWSFASWQLVNEQPSIESAGFAEVLHPLPVPDNCTISSHIFLSQDNSRFEELNTLLTADLAMYTPQLPWESPAFLKPSPHVHLQLLPLLFCSSVSLPSVEDVAFKGKRTPELKPRKISVDSSCFTANFDYISEAVGLRRVWL